MKDTLIKIITDNGGNILTRRITESYFKKNYFELYSKINSSFDSSVSFNAKLYLIYHEITENPKCIICNNNTKFKKFSQGFSKYCSMKCVGKDNKIQIKRENTTKELYGGKYTLTSPVLIKNIKKTNLKKYGVEHPQQLKSIKEKTIQTNLKKYGVEHHLKLKSQIEKQKKTNLKKYGVENVNQNICVHDKVMQTNLKKYDTKYPAQNIDVQTKTKNNNQKKYGVDYIFQSKKIHDKIKITNLKKYGFEQPSRNKSVIERIKNSNKQTKQKNGKIFWSKKLGLNIEDINYDEFGEIVILNYCKIHSAFTISKSLLKNRLRENIENVCTQCNPINENVSIKENEMRNFIENELNIATEKIRINNKEIDIYISNNKLGIEFNGLYWHSCQYKDNDYHLNKTNECEKLGIQLIQIFEDEWVNKKEIVKSIIKSKLGVINNKIFARKCEIKEINNDVCSKFLENNHIQGNINSSTKIGLFYSNELVSTMTFGKKRASLGNKNIGGEYELLRFCNKLNTIVVGGGDKLLKYFIKNYHPKNILTYADRRYSQGNLYEHLGFNFMGNTRPNYWYFNNKTKELKRYYRYSYRKNILIKQGFDESKTEHQIMEERGYLRVYDCGHMKFELFKNM
jgi:hypothetical protein